MKANTETKAVYPASLLSRVPAEAAARFTSYLCAEDADRVRLYYREDALKGDGTPLYLIGGWDTIAGYYASPEGKVYSISYGGPPRFSYCATIEELFNRFNLRGGLFVELKPEAAK